MKTLIGFSLLELLTVIAIISILSAFCFPIYSQHILQAKRSEAILSLTKLASALEQHYSIHHTYKNATLKTLGFPENVADNHYQLLLATTETSYKVAAEPLATQAKKDTLCGTLTLNTQGEKGFSGSGKLKDCWL
ncbi:MAG: type IV pilin protein [Gammaproteobacteria bacterium]